MKATRIGFVGDVLGIAGSIRRSPQQARIVVQATKATLSEPLVLWERSILALRAAFGLVDAEPRTSISPSEHFRAKGPPGLPRRSLRRRFVLSQ
jgi:hypothetical protein